MLTCAVSPHTEVELITKYMDFTDKGSVIEYRDEVSLSGKILRWDTQTKHPKECTIDRIDILEEVFMTTRCFIEIRFENSTLRIISLSTDFTSRDIMAGDGLLSHADFCELAKIGKLRSCEDLICRDISIHTIEPEILRKHTLEVCHEIDKSHIIIRGESSVSPYRLKLRMRCHNHRIYLHLIRSEITIGKYSTHRCSVPCYTGAEKTWHHMCDDFESCILEKPRRFDRFFVPVSAFIERVDLIVRRLISDLDTSHSIPTKTDDLFGSDPVRTSLDRHADDS